MPTDDAGPPKVDRPAPTARAGSHDAWSRWLALAPVTRGILAMILSTVSFTLMHAAIVHVSRDIHPFQIAFARNIFGLIVFVPIIARSGLAVFHTSKIGLHILRNVLNVGAMLMFFTALALTPMSRVTALSFTAPLFMAALSVLVLGEKFHARRAGALLVGFAGALLILQPGFVAVDVGAMLVLGSALVWALTMIVIKFLARTDGSTTIAAHMVLWLSLFSIIPAATVWVWPTPGIWATLVFIGVSGTIAQILLTEALKLADSSEVMPFDFLKLIWATLFGFVFFGQVPDVVVWIGAAIIFSSGMVVIADRDRRPSA